MATAEVGTHERSPACACGAVEGRAKQRSRLAVALRGVGGIIAQLGAEAGGATARAIACLTSTRRVGHPRHVGIVTFAVFIGTTITASEASRLTVERVARAPKGGVE